MLTEAQINWVEDQLAANGYTLQSDVELTHERAWSRVATVHTKQGKLYYKMTRPDLKFEVKLTEALFNWGMPVPEVVAVDADEGWLLMKDSGVSLRSLLQGDGNIERWHTAVTHYAHMQIALIPKTDKLLATGLFDRRLELLPTLYDELLADVPAMMIGQKDGLTPEEYTRLQQLSGQYAALCQQLAACDIPQTIQHDDFHDANIFVKDGVYTFADWGETCFTHPFFSLIIVLRNAAYILKLAENDPALHTVLETYLAQWQAFGTPAEIRATFEIAHTVGMVNRSLSWYASLKNAAPEERSEDAAAVPGWLQEFLSAIG